MLGLLALLAWEIGGFDLALSRHYGTHDGFPWRDAWLTRAVLHDGGRVSGWCVMAFMVGQALWPADDESARTQRWYWIGVSLLCLLLVPTIKRLTASSCPWDLAEFGGVAAYVPHWRLGVRDGGAGHCFPSGHAVAAFGFLSLYFDRRSQHPRSARLCLVLVCLAGALYGWAQLARGAHYLSHTLWSAWLCWSVCALARVVAVASRGRAATAQRVMPGGATAAASHCGPSNQASPRSAARSIGNASTPQNRRPSTSNVGTPNTPRAIASSVCVAQPPFDLVAGRIAPGASVAASAARRAASPASAPPRQTWRITVSTDVPVRRAAVGAQASARRSSGSGLNGCVAGVSSAMPCVCAQPRDLAKGPGALGLDFGRPLLAPVVEQAGEQHRPVLHLVRQPSSACGRCSNAR